MGDNLMGPSCGSNRGHEATEPVERTAIQVAAPHLPEVHQPSVVQFRQVVRDEGVVDAKATCNLGHRQLAAADDAKDLDASWVGEGTTEENEITFHTYKSR